MNWIHRRLCGSDRWRVAAADRLVPFAVGAVSLGADVLEIGPGYGATTGPLSHRVGPGGRLTALELDPALAARLSARFEADADAAAGAVEVVHGDGTAMPFEDARFSSVVCMTMLHHVPSTDLQDRLFAEARRVLAPGGTFAGSDSLMTPRTRVLHLNDTFVPLDPDALEDRLAAAGFADPKVNVQNGRRVRFTARAA